MKMKTVQESNEDNRPNQPAKQHWENNLDARPDWDTYFLTGALWAAQRSFDPSSVCGAILVSKKKKVLSTGYNGPLPGSIDEEIPTQRPEKYSYFLHAEENCLLAYSGGEANIEGSSMYITGRPCHKCLRMMLGKGIKRIVYANISKTILVDQAELDIQTKMISLLKEKPIITVVESDPIKKLLRRSISYILHKEQQ